MLKNSCILCDFCEESIISGGIVMWAEYGYPADADIYTLHESCIPQFEIAHDSVIRWGKQSILEFLQEMIDRLKGYE